jgi:hypothetical protein
MTYLDLPRFTISGSFYTDPSTVDNDPSHYDASCTNPSPWQDPGGSHSFSFQDLLAGQTPNRDFTTPTVSCAFDKNGNAQLGDPLVNTVVASMDAPNGMTGVPLSPAKMIDLDVYQQAVSTIYGFFMKLQVGATTLIGAMDPTALNSVRFDRVLPTRGWQPWDSYGAGSFGGDTYASGVFQAVLRIPASSWPASSGSPVLDQIRSLTQADQNSNLLLSIRFTLDGYQNVAWHSEDFRIGRLLATVGPVLAGDPAQCVAGRWLQGYTVNQGNPGSIPWNQPSLYGAPFQVRQIAAGWVVSMDLSNALMAAEPGGAPLDLGNLSVYIGDGSTGVVGAPFQLNGVFYSLSGGIVDLPLTAAQYAASQSAPFFIVSSRTDIVGLSTFNSLPVLWAESATGLRIACDSRAFQLASDTPSQGSATSAVYVTQWGAPVTNPAVIQCGVYPCDPGNGAATVPWSAGYKGNTPGSGLFLLAGLTLQEPGVFQLQLNANGNPGSRTSELDSQLYFICVWPANGPAPSPNLTPYCPPQEQIVSAVLWASYTLNAAPDFAEIQQIMKIYVKLFPAMKAKMDLTDHQTFFTFAANPGWGFFQSQNLPGPTQFTLPNGGVITAGSIPYFMTRGFEDPRFMPIMRNLSPNKLLTVLCYCYNVQQGLVPPPTTTSF